ncbi:LuxR C-terminal-related transcriptional regulator [Allobranchiibius sp. GilTou73]|uniref:LuxR C-terminal-related transcriptional regulator n=1 Tax=Allobranchiibius sp. GilTou73 TaxID=2904523 RepID=UPI001F203A57|nr:LuxR C-terminal-related transcriptional regulator [Allobranchiibius sp. GilTou73]UIJ35949.1 LuxR C-terminal-related transcriptional regulator [Allobranchiibius sp. GilTou73]
MLSEEPRSRVCDDGGSSAVRSRLGLDVEAAQLYADVRLTPFLRRLLARSGSLLRTSAGSISLVDQDHQRYHKVAERGALCRLGQAFSLDEGVTGRVVARRGPVLLNRYADVASGHLATDHPAHGGSVLAVPIWWCGEVIAVNVGFAGVRRAFSVAEVDALEMLSQLAAAGLVQGARYPSVNASEDRVQPAVETAEARKNAHRPGASPSPFTAREEEVAVLLSHGYRDRDIATTLSISPRTVEKHVAAVLRKAGTSSRTSAVVRCLAQGWVAAP